MEKVDLTDAERFLNDEEFEEFEMLREEIELLSERVPLPPRISAYSMNSFKR